MGCVTAATQSGSFRTGLTLLLPRIGTITSLHGNRRGLDWGTGGVRIGVPGDNADNRRLNASAESQSRVTYHGCRLAALRPEAAKERRVYYRTGNNL
jgi:hypothetical protein